MNKAFYPLAEKFSDDTKKVLALPILATREFKGLKPPTLLLRKSATIKKQF